MANPVLLIPGFTDTTEILKHLADHLWQMGFHVHPFAPRPSDGTVPLEDLAAQLQAFVDLTFGPTTPIDVVAFSMGGLISRWYVQKLGGGERVQRLITLATPHNGTVYAYLPGILPERLPISLPGLRQMQPDSTFLAELNRDTTALSQINFSSLWTPLDLTIVPSNSSIMDVAHNIRLPLAHHWAWLTHPTAFEVIVGELRREA